MNNLIRDLQDLFDMAWDINDSGNGTDLSRKVTTVVPGALQNLHAINSSTIKAEPKWISVEDRLPENGQKVLCWYEYFRFGNYNRMYRTYGIGYCFHGNWGGEVAQGQRCKVLAWMPLPEPPEDFPDIEEDDHGTEQR